MGAKDGYKTWLKRRSGCFSDFLECHSHVYNITLESLLISTKTSPGQHPATTHPPGDLGIQKSGTMAFLGCFLSWPPPPSCVTQRWTAPKYGGSTCSKLFIDLSSKSFLPHGKKGSQGPLQPLLPSSARPPHLRAGEILQDPRRWCQNLMRSKMVAWRRASRRAA